MHFTMKSFVPKVHRDPASQNCLPKPDGLTFITNWLSEMSEMKSHKFSTSCLLIQSLSLVKRVWEPFGMFGNQNIVEISCMLGSYGMYLSFQTLPGHYTYNCILCVDKLQFARFHYA